MIIDLGTLFEYLETAEVATHTLTGSLSLEAVLASQTLIQLVSTAFLAIWQPNRQNPNVGSTRNGWTAQEEHPRSMFLVIPICSKLKMFHILLAVLGSMINVTPSLRPHSLVEGTRPLGTDLLCPLWFPVQRQATG